MAIVLLVLLLLFGAKRLPEVGRSLGAGMREFKDSVTGATPRDGSSTAALPASGESAPVVPAAASRDAVETTSSTQ